MAPPALRYASSCQVHDGLDQSAPIQVSILSSREEYQLCLKESQTSSSSGAMWHRHHQPELLRRVMGYRTPTRSTASPTKVCVSPTRTVSRAAPPVAPPSSPGKTPTAPGPHQGGNARLRHRFAGGRCHNRRSAQALATPGAVGQNHFGDKNKYLPTTTASMSSSATCTISTPRKKPENVDYPPEKDFPQL